MLKRLTDYLDRNKVKYIAMAHSPAYTSEEIAAIAHLPGKEIAKTVMMKIEEKMTMIVLPASYMIDFSELRRVLAAQKTELATEDEFRGLFPECEVGAMPPFGNLFGIEVVVEKSLAMDQEIAFNAGTHNELLRMTYRDFDRLVKPRALSFGVPKRTHETDVEHLTL